MRMSASFLMTLSRAGFLTLGSGSCPLLLPPSIFPSLRVFSNESVLRIRWPNYWSFSFSISPSNEYSGLISFRADWLDLLAVQGTFKSLLQHRCSKTFIHSALVPRSRSKVAAWSAGTNLAVFMETAREVSCPGFSALLLRHFPSPALGS